VQKIPDAVAADTVVENVAAASVVVAAVAGGVAVDAAFAVERNRNQYSVETAAADETSQNPYFAVTAAFAVDAVGTERIQGPYSRATC
jgi:hypothetical protein